MWIIYNTETGARIGELVSEQPTELPEGQTSLPVPPSAMIDVSAWSVAARAFVEVPLIDGPMMGRLLTWDEVVALVSHPVPEISRLPILWMLLIAFGQPQRANSPLHISTGEAMFAGGIFNAARRAQFLAGEPVGDPA